MIPMGIGVVSQFRLATFAVEVGGNLADIVALSSMEVLAGVEGVGKFEAAASLLRYDPEAVDLN